MCSTPKATARTKRHRQAPEQSYSEYSAMITRSNVSYNKRLHEKKLIMMNSTYPHVRIAHIKHVVCHGV